MTPSILSRRKLMAGAFAASAGFVPLKAMASPRPNVVILVSDDQPPDAFTNAMPLTAARQDLTWYRRAYGENPECDPARCSVLSGLTSVHHGVTDNTRDANFNWTRTLATLLQSQGYKTGLLGKALHKTPSKLPPTYIPPGWDRWLEAKSPVYNGGTFNDQGTLITLPTAPQNYDSEYLGTQAIQFLQDAVGAGRNFFLYLAPHGVHQSCVAESKYSGLYKKIEVPRAASFNQVPVNGPTWNRSFAPYTPDQIKSLDHKRQGVWRAERSLDDLFVTKVLATLTALNVADNTIVIYLTDQGISIGEHRWQLKRTAYQEVVNTPVIVRWPSRYGIAPGTNSQLISFLDIAPTVLARLGIAPAWTMDGIDFLTRTRPYAPIYWPGGARQPKHQETPGFRAVTDGRYKFIQLNDDRNVPGVVQQAWGYGEREFYDLVNDGADTYNGFNDPAFAGPLGQLQDMWQQYFGS